MDGVSDVRQAVCSGCDQDVNFRSLLTPWLLTPPTRSFWHYPMTSSAAAWGVPIPACVIAVIANTPNLKIPLDYACVIPWKPLRLEPSCRP